MMLQETWQEAPPAFDRRPQHDASFATSTPVSLRPALRLVATEVSTSIRTDVPEYRGRADDELANEVRRVVSRAVELFGQLVTTEEDPGLPLPAGHAEAFRDVGLGEAEAGRGKAAVLGAYRVATYTALCTLSTVRLPPDAVAMTGLRTAIRHYVEHLAELSGEGHDDGVALGAGRDRARARLASALLRPYGVSSSLLERLSAAAAWPLPQMASVAELRGVGTVDDTTLHELVCGVLGAGTLVARIDGRSLTVVPDEVDPMAVEVALNSFAGTTRVIVGCRTPLGELTHSARWAHRAIALLESGKIPQKRVVHSEDHLAALLHTADEPLGQILVERRLAPLLEIGPQLRLMYGELASALLEVGRNGQAPGVLDVPKSTLQYRVDRLHELFGAAWDDRDARLDMMLALRSVLPRWRSEAEYARKHPRARTGPPARGHEVGPTDQLRARSSADPP